jgi:phosphonate transport system permease protein
MTALPDPAPPPLPRKPRSAFPLWLAALIVGFTLATRDLDIDYQALAWGASDIGEYLSRFGTPNFSRLDRYAALMAETLAMALWGTALAFTGAFVIAPFAARNLSPHPLVYRAARELLNFLRALPDLLFAVVFVAAIGLGPLPGVLAIGLHVSGFLGKVFAENLERVDPGAYEAVRASGANFLQTVMWAGWPSALQETIGYTIFILDRNVRVAAILGLVGAGGIGFELTTTLRLFQYDRTGALVIVIVVTVLAIDYLSAWARKKVR